MTTTTPLGTIHPDTSGLCHYKTSTAVGNVFAAAADALEHRNPDQPTWFWFNGTFCPIEREDVDNLHLVTRWREWRKEYRREPSTILNLLEKLTQD